MNLTARKLRKVAIYNNWALKHWNSSVHVFHEHVKLSFPVQYCLYLNYLNVRSDVGFFLMCMDIYFCRTHFNKVMVNFKWS